MQVGKKNLEINITSNQTDNGIDPFSILPEELILEIFSYLSFSDQRRCEAVNRTYQRISSDERLIQDALQKLISKNLCFFGEEDWNRYIGEVGKVPLPSKELIYALYKPSPHNPEKKTWEDHMVVLIPKEVDGNPLTLNSIGELVKKPKGGGHATRYRYIWSKILDKHGDESPDTSYWILVTKDVLPGSRGKTRDEQLALARSIEGCEAPNLLEAVTACFMRYVKTEERMIQDAPWTYTCCSEENIGGWKLVVGGFSPSGLHVDYYAHYDCYCVGVVALRKF